MKQLVATSTERALTRRSHINEALDFIENQLTRGGYSITEILHQVENSYPRIVFEDVCALFQKNS